MSDGDQRPNVAKAYAEHQAELPRLPIPSLESTCEKLLKWSAPLLTEDELEESKEAVDEFLSNPNQVRGWGLLTACCDCTRVDSPFLCWYTIPRSSFRARNCNKN